MEAWGSWPNRDARQDNGAIKRFSKTHFAANWSAWNTEAAHATLEPSFVLQITQFHTRSSELNEATGICHSQTTPLIGLLSRSRCDTAAPINRSHCKRSRSRSDYSGWRVQNRFFSLLDFSLLFLARRSVSVGEFESLLNYQNKTPHLGWAVAAARTARHSHSQALGQRVTVINVEVLVYEVASGKISRVKSKLYFQFISTGETSYFQKRTSCSVRSRRKAWLGLVKKIT